MFFPLANFFTGSLAWALIERRFAAQNVETRGKGFALPGSVIEPNLFLAGREGCAFAPSEKQVGFDYGFRKGKALPWSFYISDSEAVLYQGMTLVVP